MIRRKFTAAVAASAAVAGTVVAILVGGAGSASAAPAVDTFHCTGTPFVLGSRVCTAHVFSGAQVFNAQDMAVRNLPANDEITVTCWFKESGAFEDHVTHENIPSPVTGHVPDVFVNFNMMNPNSSTIALPHCG